MTKKVCWFIFFFIFLIGSILAIYFGVQYAKEKEHSKSMFTQEEVLEEVNLKCKEYVAELNDKNAKIELLNKSVSEKEIKIAEDEETIISLNSQIDDLNSQIEIKDNEISRLNVSDEENKSKIEQLEADKQLLLTEKTSLQNQLKECQSSLSEKEIEIENLKETKTNLENQIVELNAELQAYKDKELTDVYAVKFMNDDSLVDMFYIQQGNKINNAPVIENTEDLWFYGWSLTEDFSEMISLDDYVPASDVTFYAKTGETVPVCLRVSSYVYCGISSDKDSYYLMCGAELTAEDVIVFSDYLDFSDENLNYEIRGFSKSVSINSYISNKSDIPITSFEYVEVGPNHSADDGSVYRTSAYLIEVSVYYKAKSDDNFSSVSVGSSYWVSLDSKGYSFSGSLNFRNFYFGLTEILSNGTSLVYFGNCLKFAFCEDEIMYYNIVHVDLSKSVPFYIGFTLKYSGYVGFYIRIIDDYDSNESDNYYSLNLSPLIYVPLSCSYVKPISSACSYEP